MTTIRAAVCHAFNEPLVVEEVALRAPQAGEVEVTLKACAICHSDILYAEGAWGGTLPAVYGHEAAGVVSGVGAGVTDFAEGDPVIVTLIRSCGHCASCAQGAPVQCETGYDRAKGPLSALDGGVMEHGLNTGAFAEKVVVAARQCAHVPAEMPMDQASLLACGVITGVGAVNNTARVEPGSTVVVIGAGGVGLNTIQGAAIAGARRVIAIDIAQDKLDAAKAFGATDGVLATSDKPHRQVRQILGGTMADYVFVTVGAIQAHQSAARYAKKRGKVVIVGMPASGEEIHIEPVMVAAMSHTIVGSNMGETNLARDIPALVDLWRQGRLKLAELITNRYPLEKINEAIADTKAGHARRNVIVFD